MGSQLNEIQNTLSGFPASFTEEDFALATEYQAQLGSVKELLDGFLPNQALRRLESLKGRIWDKATSDDKYRILAYMGIGYLLEVRELKSAQKFIDAYRFNPESAKATVNAALGHLLRNENDRCRELAKQALDDDPTMLKAYSMLIWASQEEKFAVVVESVPEIYRNTAEVAMAIGNMAFHQEMLSEAESWLRISVKENNRNLPDPYSRLAAVLMAKIPQNYQIVSVPGWVNPYQDVLDEVIGLYDRAWERVAATEIAPYRLEWLLNRSAAKVWSGDVEGAIQDLDEASHIKKDDLNIVHRRALLAYQTGDLSKAESLFRQVLEANPESNAKFGLAVVLLNKGKLAESERLVREVITENQESDLVFEATHLMASIKLERQQFSDAREIVNSLPEKFTGTSEVLILQAQIAGVEGKSEEAALLLSQAQDALPEQVNYVTRRSLAQELYKNGLFEKAAVQFEKIIDVSVDCNSTRQLLSCYYYLGELRQALEICEGLRKEHGPLQFVTEMEVAIYQEIDELSLAHQICAQYLELYPDNSSVELQFALLNYRLEKYEALDKFLEEVDLQEFSLGEYSRIISLLLEREFYWKALNVAYEVRRRFFDQLEAHQLYVGKVFFRIPEDKQQEWFDVDDVQADTAVQIAGRTGMNPKWVVIEEREAPNIQQGEFNLSHPSAQALLHKRVGDSINIPQGVFAEEVKIKQISSKFVYAMNESLEVYSLHFPEVPGIWRFPVHYSENQVAVKETFQPLFDMLDQHHADVTKGKRLYEEKKLPIGALAQFLNCNPIDVYVSLIARPSPGLFCSSGNFRELQKAVQSLGSRPDLIVDIVSLLTIHRLNIEDVVIDAYGKLGIVRSTLDVIEQLLQERLGLGRAKMLLAKEGDRYVKTPVTQELIDYNKRILENILTWTREHCSILPCRAALDVERKERAIISESIGACFLDTLLTAHYEQRILFSDDAIFRNLALRSYGVQGVWMQPLLVFLRDGGYISEETYSQAVIKLAGLNYHHTSISAKDLLEATKLSKWQPVSPFSQVVKVLGGHRSDLEPSIQVATKYIYMLWEQQLAPDRYEDFILSVLDAIASGRDFKERDLGVRNFEEKMLRKLYLAPISANRIRKIVNLWRATHV